MYDRIYGTKAKETDKLSTTEIAKLIRTEIREKIKKGHFPKEMKVSVTSEYYSGGSSISISITSLPFNPHNPEYIRHYIENPHEHIAAHLEYTPETSQIIKELEAIGSQYNYDGSDSMIDYFDVRYYLHVGIYWEYNHKCRKEMEEMIKEGAELKKEEEPKEQLVVQEYVKNEIQEAEILGGQFIREIEAVYKSQEWVNHVLSSPEEVAHFLNLKIGNKTEEYFVALFLDVKNDVTGWSLVSKGTASESLVHPREVFKNAILTNSSSVIIAHNHPSGTLQPSSEDIKTTERVREAGKLIGIPVLDHVIVNSTSYYSMREGGVI